MAGIQILLLVAVICVESISAKAQSKNQVGCDQLKAIVEFFQTRKQADTTVTYPLGRKAKRVFADSPLGFINGNTYYTSVATIPGEIKSQFTENNGQWYYEVILGAYDSTEANTYGMSWKQTILDCIRTADWKVSEMNDISYLFMSYNRVDITVTLLKPRRQKNGVYTLYLGIMRITKM